MYAPRPDVIKYVLYHEVEKLVFMLKLLDYEFYNLQSELNTNK